MFTEEVLNFETVERMPCGTVRLEDVLLRLIGYRIILVGYMG